MHCVSTPHPGCSQCSSGSVDALECECVLVARVLHPLRPAVYRYLISRQCGVIVFSKLLSVSRDRTLSSYG